jgi:hypothetical protein
MGVLSFYTHGHSIRYFLTLTLLLILYTSFKLSLENRIVRNSIIAVIALNVLIIQSILWNINLDKDRSVKATMFKIENFSETSAHFLNFSPVLDIVHKYKIGELETKQDYFIGKVFNFYKNEFPEINDYKNRLRIDYDYEVRGSGFKMDTTFANKP